MSACAMVVYGNNRIFSAFHHTTNSIGGTFLHFRIRPLYGVQFNGGTEFARIGTGDRSTTHPDAVVVTTKDYDFISCFGFVLQGLFRFAVADTSRLHNDFIVAQASRHLISARCDCFLVFKCQYRTCN